MLTLLCCCTGAWADEVDNDTHLKYTVADNEVTITGFADGFTPGANYALVIPDVIDGKPVVAVGASAFIDKTNFTTLTIGKNVKTIGTDAFRRTTSMTSVTFAPDGVLETLGESAFRGCSELTAFVMPNTVTTIGQYALAVNAKLASVTLSNQLTTLSTQALCDCPMLKTVVIPASVTTIESRAFKNYSEGLEEITIPSTVTSVASDAFYICNNLNTVTWNSATVPENIFKDKTSLQTVTLGEGVKTIGSSAFMNCTGLTDLSIANTVKTINASAFYGCTALGSVTIPALVSKLPNEVFKGCTSLASVSFAEGSLLTQMTVGVFSGCSMLNNFTIPATVNYIGSDCFYQCSQLKSIVIPSSVTYLGVNAFKECTALESATFGQGIQLENIPAGCFRGCSSLVGVDIPASVKRIEGDTSNGAFQISGIQYVNFAENCIVEHLGTSAFRGCAELTEFVMPNTVTTIGNYVLQANAKLASVILSNQLTSLSTQALCNCPLLTHITIPSSVTTINYQAFWDCTGLSEIVIPHNVHTLGDNLFRECSSNLTIDLSACSNVWELYSGNTNVTTKYSVPNGATVILPPGSTATGTNIQVTNLGTLAQDSEDYYLIGSAADFNKFATIVRSNPTANARLTADIELTGDELTIGLGTDESNCIAYGGTFDGQGHTITLNYTGANKINRSYGGLFSWTNGATIQNLTVDGAIETTQPKVGGIVSGIKGTLTMQKCKAASTITGIVETLTEMHLGGMLGYTHSADITLTDCMSCGSIMGGSNVKFCSDFFGRITNGTKVTLNYNLAMTNYDSQLDFVGRFWLADTSNPTSNYSGSANIVVNQGQSTGGGIGHTSTGITSRATLAQLADGTVAYRLQAGRTDLVWGQRIGTDTEPVMTNDESYRVYRCINGGYTNDPTLAYEGLQKDVNDNYLLGCVLDWKDFAEIVNSGTNNTANAKMTADIDLGDDQTMIGTSDAKYQGIFDGQGHTLTVNWTTTGNYCAPFPYINGATFKNLHVTGTINTSHRFTGGLVGQSKGTSYINNCRSNVEMISSYSGDAVRGGFAASVEGGTLNFNDCIFDGKFEGASSQTWGGFVGWRYSGSVNIQNGLFVPKSVNVSATYSATFSGNGGTVTNSYYTVQINNSNQGTLVSSGELTDGTTTTALNNGRSEVFWVQDAVTNMPMLATFANAVTLTDVNDLTALSAYAGKTCKVTYSRSFTEAKSSTVCLPFAFAKGSVGTFYTFTGITHEGSNYEATMTEYTGDNLVANTPYLFTPSATGDVDFSGTYTLPASITAGSTESGDWTYLGTYETISWTEAPTGIYGFSAQAVEEQGISQGQFVKVGAYVRIKPMRCYLKYKSGSANYAGARGMTRAADEELPETIKVRLIGADGEVTAIGSLQTKTGEVTFDKDAWYSLDGRRIEGKPTVKGIYVNNGKKVIIK